ncbi:hypothetical protein Fot_53558 [Forsythia ovata]|uniref:Uncharacterized protein n=1 Tax=Forsythia ovata TaxID=205694 RepID=A0ABD1PJ33_9LAMI
MGAQCGGSGSLRKWVDNFSGAQSPSPSTTSARSAIGVRSVIHEECSSKAQSHPLSHRADVCSSKALSNNKLNFRRRKWGALGGELDGGENRWQPRRTVEEEMGLIIAVNGSEVEEEMGGFGGEVEAGGVSSAAVGAGGG